MKKAQRRGRAQIPSMTELLDAAAARPRLNSQPRSVVTDALRRAVGVERQAIASGSDADPCSVDTLLTRAESLIEKRVAQRLRRVINATGIVLHTGLGRSVLPEAARQRVLEVAAGYCSLEIDLDSGQRGRRGEYAEQLLRDMTRAEAAMIVNNNAAATMLALRGLARGREVIVSRGQLIEIGGSFRLPEVMTAGEVTLREVGTTNKTRVSDYEEAICDRTGLIMHVHTSNYRVVGFSDTPQVGQLVELAHARGLPMFDDLGSGALLDEDIWSAASEPTAVDSLRLGADLVAFSGDKLLGGPQAGILLGRREIVDALRRDPMARALRVDKLTLAALEATLELYQSPETVKSTVPTLAGLAEPIEPLITRARGLAERLSARLPDQTFKVVRQESYAGGGSLPAWPLPTAAVQWRPRPGLGATQCSWRLRMGDPPVLARIRDDHILFDLRSIRDAEFDEIAAAALAASTP